MLILLIVNATDGMWKIGGVGKYSLLILYSCCSIFSSHLVDAMGQGTLRSVSTLQASMEKFQGSMFSYHECLDLEMFLEVEEPTNTRKSLVEDHLTDGEDLKVPNTIGLDGTHAGTSVQKLCDVTVLSGSISSCHAGRVRKPWGQVDQYLAPIVASVIILES